MTECPTCGAEVKIISTGEGTNYYEPAVSRQEGMRKMERETKYYMVHNPNNRQPYKQHFNKDEAVEEANRLAKIHIGQRFFVLESVECFAVVQPEPVKILLRRNDEA